MWKAVAIASVVMGAACGLYLGVWWAFIGGIIDVVQAIRAEELEVQKLAIGIGKVVFCQLFAFVGAIPALPGYLWLRTRL